MIMDEMKDIMVPTTEVQTWLWKLLTHQYQNSLSAVCGKVTKINLKLVNSVSTFIQNNILSSVFAVWLLSELQLKRDEVNKLHIKFALLLYNLTVLSVKSGVS